MCQFYDKRYVMWSKISFGELRLHIMVSFVIGIGNQAFGQYWLFGCQLKVNIGHPWYTSMCIVLTNLSWILVYIPVVQDATAEWSYWHLQPGQAETLVASETTLEDAGGVWDQPKPWVLPSDKHDQGRHARIYSDQYGHSRPGEVS